MDWSEVHPEAERLEHAVSDEVLARMDALLGHPERDPHGDPIPTARGGLTGSRLRLLAEQPVGAELEIVRVLDQSPEVLRSLGRRCLRPGATLTVQGRDAGAGTLSLRVGRRRVVLGESVARRIVVRPA